MGSRRKYSQEFKQEAVQLASQAGVSVAQVARDLGLQPNMLTRWRRESVEGGIKAFRGQGVPRDQELAQLKRDLGRVTRERDFLKEAAAYFAKTSR
jgi:transposase